jgi:cyanophycin synthetase
MRIGAIRVIAGPNIYSYRPVLLMKLDLEDLAGRESREIPGFNHLLLELLPGLAKHHCSKGREGGFVERLDEGTYFGHVVEHVTLELTTLTGIPVVHGKTRFAGEPGWYHIVIEYKAEKGTRRLLQMAVELVESLVKGKPFPLEKRLEETIKLIASSEPGPSTKAIIEAAARRGIPSRRIGEDSLVQLGYGKHRRLIQATMTERTSAVAVDIASDKDLTRNLLAEAGIATPRGMLATTLDEAVEALDEIGPPLAVKPYNACQGKGVSLNLTTPAQIEHAFRIAKQYAEKVVVEQQLVGRDYRALVINGKMAAASERIPAHVTGDGKRAIAELIEITNQGPERGDGHDRPLTRIVIDPVMEELLRRRGLTVNSVPREGEVVYLRECANLSTGGTAKDVTELAHPEVVAMCERAARIIGLDVCGIDLILDDIAEPLAPGKGVIEVNAAPGLRMHTAPSEGRSRDVGRAIVEMLYPDGSNGRIPIISITGTNGKTTITRMIGHVLSEVGKDEKVTVGMTTTDGIYVSGKLIVRGDTTGSRSAQTVLSDPAVDVAVLETARGGLARDGLGYDWSDISVISNIRLDHVGQDGIENLDDLLFVKSLVAERVREGGTLILNADDERLAQLMKIPRVKRVKKNVVYFSMHPPHDLIRRHLSAGGDAYLYKNGWIIEAAGNVETRVVRAAEIPVTLDGAATFNIANALAATAACRAYGLSREGVAQALRSFRSDLHNAGRAGLYEIAGAYVLVDYGHNPDAFSSVCQMAGKWIGRRVTAIIGVPGDRDDSVVEQAGRAAARGFERIIIKEDRDLRGRRGGEIAELLRAAVMSEAPECECQIVLDETEALRTALSEIEPDEVVVIFYEKLDPALSVLKEFGAAPAQMVPQLLSRMNESSPASATRAFIRRRFAQL